MKAASTLLLIVLACTALMPCAPVLFLGERDGQSSIGSLDVCNSTVPAVTAGGEMPCVNDCVGVQAPFYRSISTEPQQSILSYFILSTQNERPPKV